MNLDKNTRLTLMEDCVNVLNEMVDQLLTFPFSSEHVLERWSKKYLRSQRPLPELDPSPHYQYNVMSGASLWQ